MGNAANDFILQFNFVQLLKDVICLEGAVFIWPFEIE
jgi:hypothetical protein